MSEMKLKTHIIGFENLLPDTIPEPEPVTKRHLPPVLEQAIQNEIQNTLVDYIERNVDIVQGGDF